MYINLDLNLFCFNNLKHIAEFIFLYNNLSSMLNVINYYLVMSVI